MMPIDVGYLCPEKVLALLSRTCEGIVYLRQNPSQATGPLAEIEHCDSFNKMQTEQLARLKRIGHIDARFIASY
jgi:hypothetical protein